MSQTARQLARQIFTEAMAATTVDAACARTLSVHNNVLTAGEHSYDLARFANVQIVSIGKAGATLFDAVRSLLPSGLNIASVISAPFPPQTLDAKAHFFQGGHPLPNTASIEAAEAALSLLATADERTLVLYLISGGASAMFEKPLDPAITLPDLIELNRQLVASGAPIQQINAVRKHLSAVKGGRLAAAAPLAARLSLFISDVPADALDALASGPTLPDSTTVADCRAVATEFLDAAALPASVRSLLLHDALPETPKHGDPIFNNAHHMVLLDNAALLSGAERAAMNLGYTVTIDNSCDDWDYADAAEYLVDRATALATLHPRSCLLSGGEVTVRLPSNSGAGGRNQQLAVFAARALAQLPNATLLCAGSDGIDGNSPAAGGVVDETTWARAGQLGLEPDEYLTRFDTFSLLGPLGDTLITGPSGNNLRDIRILLTGPDTQAT